MRGTYRIPPVQAYRIRVRWDRIALGTATGVLWAVLAAWGVALLTELPPCDTEDSVSCYWDADTMGNGTGNSFTVDHNGNVTFTK